ncbi:Coenzyme F420 hydrogenase/dehydrogenase, beta subunit C-terminal domain [Gordonia alkanivorans]|uniref:Coenzyme F420 hydrogenase/dehydrogenase, beta subunit C-terminal domain n=1 Tax=Gordonia alkanivorans TaxID=84096 RepID=UPI0024B6BA11|nr:Coenzyme F420 hydrogenase/dehydrogenase, beta subunit C-terminal domain [Gordonia alkanivorans]MDJ0029631.1 Coenzyme F420 hydrogenase/dehydrogenase, beta subunit C-terminal domain [Gordonia alkanivorans]
MGDELSLESTPETKPTVLSVVNEDICVGCGACVAATRGKVPISFLSAGYYQADLSDASADDLATASSVCPFANESKNEDELGHDRFAGAEHDEGIGFYRSLYAGRITDTEEIPGSSSGGSTTWLLTELLKRDLIDAIIHVSEGESRLFEYTISMTVEEVRRARKSKYHPATMDAALNTVRESGLRYAIVGVPCVIRAARLVADQDGQIERSLRFYVGIVCGHLKSAAYAESFAWQLGISPSELDAVDFRIKDPALTSRQYRFGAKARGSAEWTEAQTLSLVGGSWGHAVFQLNACDYCDDVFAETADVVFGDAWLPKYEIDWRGTNLIVTRDPKIDEIVREGIQAGDLDLDVITPEAATRSQAGNFRHRREGLAVRLADAKAEGRWVPHKRVSPGYEHVTPARVELIRMRQRLSRASHAAFADAKRIGSLDVYLQAIGPLITAYNNLTKMSFSTRVRNKAKRESWKVLNKSRAVFTAKSGGDSEPQTYVILTGVSGNLGDAVIRRQVLEWCRGSGRIHAYVGNTSDGWQEELGLKEGEYVYSAAERRQWLRGLVVGRGRRLLVFDPGEVPLGRAHLRSEIVFLGVVALVRLRRGKVVRPPRAVGDSHPATHGLYRLSSRLSNVVLWRDRPSKESIGVGELVPDTAFGLSTQAGVGEGARRLVVVSLRGKRPIPGAEWFEGLTKFAARNGFRIVTCSQVDEDEQRALELADRFGDDADYLPWGSRRDIEQEVYVRELYERAALVVSDRLHALILASKSGAIPAEVVEKPVPKVATHFSTIGYEETSLDSSGRSPEEIAGFLQRQMNRSDELSEKLNHAQSRVNEIMTNAVK